MDDCSLPQKLFAPPNRICRQIGPLSLSYQRYLQDRSCIRQAQPRKKAFCGPPIRIDLPLFGERPWMSRTLTILFRRDPSRDRQTEKASFEGYEILWPDGQPVA